VLAMEANYFGGNYTEFERPEYGFVGTAGEVRYSCNLSTSRFTDGAAAGRFGREAKCFSGVGFCPRLAIRI